MPEIYIKKMCPLCFEEFLGPIAVCKNDGTLLMQIATRRIAKKRCGQCEALYTNRVTVCPIDGGELEEIVGGPEDSSLRCFARNYEASRLLATGTHSLIYEGRNMTTNQPVALKLLNIQNNEPQYSKKLSRFSGPVDLHSKLVHRNIVKILDNGFNVEGSPYLAYELVKDGFSLAHLPGKLKMLPPEYFLEILVQVCDALEFASKEGLIHQDFSTGDVLISEAENDSIEIKVTDFAKGAPLIHGDNRALQMTGVGDLFGHPEFMSPEVCKGDQVNESAMIYSLGTVMYCTFAETKPFQGAHWAAIMLNKFHHEPDPLVFEFGSEITEKIRDVIERCMQMEPSERFASIADVKSALISLRQSGSQKPRYSAVRTHFTELTAV
jgi:eukaryotic-like serine/threonine-protein kinase